MGNIKNFNFNKLDFKLSNSDYWDLFLATDEAPTLECSGLTAGDCLVVWYDFNNPNIYSTGSTSATSIYSLVTWDKAVNTGYSLNTIGLTGIDNGLITFDKLSGDTSNQALLSALTNTTLIIPSGDTRLNLNRVTGTTNNFIYPIQIISGDTGYYSQFCGGFYQGFYKLDGYSYELLPTRVENAWSAEFWLKPQDLCISYSGTILNDIYPNNKGFFFYMGTRAENKFWNVWEGADTGCTINCDQPVGCSDTVSEWCTIPKESEISIIGDYGVAIPLDPPQVSVDIITNQFLIYGRAHACETEQLTGETGTIIYNPFSGSTSGETSCGCGCDTCNSCKQKHDALGTKSACDYDGKGIVVVKTSEVLTNNNNPFLVYGRAKKGGSSCGCAACSGPNDGLGNETVCSFSGMTGPDTELDYKLDVIDNALGFRVKNDGSIGYRLLTVTGGCVTSSAGTKTYVTGTTIEEQYSASGMVNTNEWSYVVIKFVTDYKADCELLKSKPRKGKLMFYVNARLKFVVDEFDEFIARRLNEYKDKQIGVPFNFSLGGGSQGLIESQTFGGLDENDRDLLIEENFAGTFIGGISEFKFNICDLTYCDIQYNYENYFNTHNLSNDVKLPLSSGIYYGKINKTTINLLDISGLTFTLTTSVVNSYITINHNVTGYGYILIPHSFEQPSNLKNSTNGCLGFNVPYLLQSDMIIKDANGFDVRYKVYRTYNRTTGEANIWMCD
jgi:hypothetical protein